MKNLFLIISAALFLLACGTEASTVAKCDKDCKKENCDHKGDKKEKKSKDKKSKKMMAIGTQNPSLEAKLMDISGTEMYIEELGKKNGTLIIFSCNTCPFVVGNGEKSEGWQNRYNDLAEIAMNSEIGFALINSNEAKRDDEDSFEKMAIHAKENGYKNMKYMVDTDHKVADAFNAMKTPHVYLFNSNNELVYTGAIDDNVAKKAEVKEHWLADAMKALASGTEIEVKETKASGCSIKRVKSEKGH